MIFLPLSRSSAFARIVSCIEHYLANDLVPGAETGFGCLVDVTLSVLCSVLRNPAVMTLLFAEVLRNCRVRVVCSDHNGRGESSLRKRK